MSYYDYRFFQMKYQRIEEDRQISFPSSTIKTLIVGNGLHLGNKGWMDQGASPRTQTLPRRTIWTHPPPMIPHRSKPKPTDWTERFSQPSDSLLQKCLKYSSVVRLTLSILVTGNIMIMLLKMKLNSIIYFIINYSRCIVSLVPLMKYDLRNTVI